MADEDQGAPARLEPPRLFGRRKGRTTSAGVTPEPEPTQVLEPEPEPTQVLEPEPDTEEPEATREPLTGRAAAVVTGVLGGLVLVGGTYGALRGCEAVQGTATCGRAGFPLLALIFVLAVVAGSALLSRFAVPDPTSTSFLATGLTAVVAMLFLLDVLDHWSMVVVIPAVSVLTYLLSHWVTTTFTEPAQE